MARAKGTGSPPPRRRFAPQTTPLFRPKVRLDTSQFQDRRGEGLMGKIGRDLIGAFTPTRNAVLGPASKVFTPDIRSRQAKARKAVLGDKPNPAFVRIISGKPPTSRKKKQSVGAASRSKPGAKPARRGGRTRGA